MDDGVYCSQDYIGNNDPLDAKFKGLWDKRAASGTRQSDGAAAGKYPKEGPPVCQADKVQLQLPQALTNSMGPSQGHQDWNISSVTMAHHQLMLEATSRANSSVSVPEAT